MATKPNYNHLYAFWVIAQEGSLLGASRRLGVRHSTLSAQMRALEETLGMRLLIRRPRGMRLTPQAEVVRNYCDEIFRLGTELLDAAREQRANRLRVCMLASVPRSLLYEALRPALEREATTRVELSVAGLDSACRSLVTGQLHVVVADRLPTGTGRGRVLCTRISSARPASACLGLRASHSVTGRIFPADSTGRRCCCPRRVARCGKGLQPGWPRRASGPASSANSMTCP